MFRSLLLTALCLSLSACAADAAVVSLRPPPDATTVDVDGYCMPVTILHTDDALWMGIQAGPGHQMCEYAHAPGCLLGFTILRPDSAVVLTTGHDYRGVTDASTIAHELHHVGLYCETGDSDHDHVDPSWGTPEFPL